MNSPALAPEDRHDTALARILHREGVLPLETIQGALSEVRARRDTGPGLTLASTLLASGVLSGDQLDRAHSLLVGEGSLRAAPAPLALGPGGFGPYQIQREIARGGMGVVYEVVHAGSGERYALKTLLAGAGHDPGELARFRREAAAMGQLDHPNVARVFAGDVFGRTPYLVQEFLTGGTLHERALRTPLDPAEAARLVQELASGLAHSHAAGILHRDLKPENVLFDAAGVPKLVDFGLAFSSDASQRLTATGALLGTPAYMAPEQALGQRDFDARVDVYGLGGILYFLLCGRAPFAGGLFQILEQVVRSPPERPRAIRAEIPPALEAICLRALAKDPQGRFGDMAGFAEALSAEAAGAGGNKRPGRALGALLALALGVSALGALWVAKELRASRESPRVTSSALGEATPEATGSKPAAAASSPAPSLIPRGLGEVVQSRDPGPGALSNEGFDVARVWSQVLTLERSHPTDLERRGAAELHSLRPGVVRIWSLEDGKSLGVLDLQGLNPLKLEGSRDQTRVAVAGEEAVAVYETRGWRRLLLLKRAVPGRVWSLAFSPGSGSLALGAGVGQRKDRVSVWSLEHGLLQRLPLKATTLAFTDEGTLALATPSVAGAEGAEELVLWSLPRERELLRAPLSEVPDSFDMEVTRDGARLFVAGWKSKEIKVWDLVEGRLLKTVSTGNVLTRLQLDPQGATLLVTTGLRRLFRLDARSLRLEDAGAVSCRSPRDALLLEDGRILTVGTDHRLRLLGPSLSPIWKTRPGRLRALAGVGQELLLADDTRLVRLGGLDAEGSRLLQQAQFPGGLHRVEVARGGARVWVVSGTRCRLTDLSGGLPLLVGAGRAPGPVRSLAAAPGGEEALALVEVATVMKLARLRFARPGGAEEGSAKLSCDWIAEAPRWGRGQVPQTHVTASGLAVTGDWGGRLQTWNLETLALLDTSSGSGSPVVSLASHEGVIYAGDRSGLIRRWRPGEEQELSPLQVHQGPVFSLCVLPGRRLASAGEDGQLVLWDLETGWRIESERITAGVPHLLHYAAPRLFVATTSGHIRAYELR